MAVTPFPRDLSALEVALRKLGGESRAASLVSERLRKAQEDITLFTPVELQQYIDPAGVEASFEQERARMLRWLIPVRNLLFTLPLILTSIALALAFYLYQTDLSSHPADTNQPFLFLWEAGFHNGNTFLAASHVAIGDAIFFLMGAIVGVYTESLRFRAKHQGQQLRRLLDDVLKILSDLALIQIRQLGNPSRSQPQALVQVNMALQQSVQVTQQVQVQILQVGDQIKSFSQDAQQFSGRLSDYLGRFDIFLNVFQQTSAIAEQRARNLEGLQQDSLRKLTEAVAQLNGIAQDLSSLTRAADDMLTQLTQQTGKTDSLLDKAEVSFDKTEARLTAAATVLNVIERDLNGAMRDFVGQTTSLANAAQQLGAYSSALYSVQQEASRNTKDLFGQMSAIAGITDNSSRALTQIVDAQTTAIQAASQVVARLDKAEQLSKQVDTLAGAVSQANSLVPLLESLVEQGQEQLALDFNPFDLLSTLAAPDPPQSLEGLKQTVDVDPEIFLEAIRLFSDRGFITLEGNPGLEKVKLTSKGREFVKSYG